MCSNQHCNGFLETLLALWDQYFLPKDAPFDAQQKYVKSILGSQKPTV
jgi:hypothetical protein